MLFYEKQPVWREQVHIYASIMFLNTGSLKPITTDLILIASLEDLWSYLSTFRFYSVLDFKTPS